VAPKGIALGSPNQTRVWPKVDMLDRSNKHQKATILHSSVSQLTDG